MKKKPFKLARSQNAVGGLVVYIVVFLIIIPTTCFAESTALPWEGFLAIIVGSISGPVANSLAILSIIVFGGLLIFDPNNATIRKAILVCFGLSIISGALVITDFFGISAGLVF